MVKVGVTGGIGSGKTTVCKVWESLGAVVVYADELAKQLMVQDDELIADIQKVFGEESYHKDGTLNRNHLAEEAFGKGRVEELNKIVHPAVKTKVEELIEQAEAHGAEMFVEEAALLLRQGRPSAFDFITLVNANKDSRVEWVKVRDGTPEEDILARMNRQKSFEELMPLCDFILENDGTVEQLKQKAKDLYRKMLKLHNTGID